MELAELHLNGRLFTWSNERLHPTLERIDRAFAVTDWIHEFPNHHLSCLSTDCSDHAPLSLKLNNSAATKPRFRFKEFWPKLDGFIDVVREAWVCPLPNADACRVLDCKLRNTAKALKAWSSQSVGSIRLQMIMARKIIKELDAAQDFRQLSAGEMELRSELKCSTLGLASLSRSIARQRSRIRHLEEGDANTRYFHLQACHRSRKNFIASIEHEGVVLTSEEAKSDLAFDFYNALLGHNFTRTAQLDLDNLQLPRLGLHGLDDPFSEDEIWGIVKEMPSVAHRAPDGFTGLFFKKTWEVIKPDIINLFNAFWSLDTRSLYLLNDALMVLLRKCPTPKKIGDYRPISLIHSVGKLLTKGLARRLAPRLHELVKNNQSAFVKGGSLYDNFRAVQLSARWSHGRNHPCVLLKVDIAKAFDSVSWEFLLELLRHAGFSLRWTDWILAILSTASTKVSINGVLSRRICHARGLRQGDLLDQ